MTRAYVLYGPYAGSVRESADFGKGTYVPYSPYGLRGHFREGEDR